MFKSFRFKKWTSMVATLMMLLSFVTPLNVFAEGTDGETVTITVLGTSDMHGAITGWNYEGAVDYKNSGLSRVKTILDEVKAENPNTVLIDNGDTIQGSILTDDLFNLNTDEKNPMVDVMGYIGYDAMVLGNHEFNFGVPVIKKFTEEAKFPVLSANIYNKVDGSNFVKPYTVKEVAGIKVGILGLTTPNIPNWDGPKVTDLEFKHMGEEAKKYVEILKEEGVDVIIASAHAGLEARHDNEGSAAKVIAEEAPEIAVLLTGHDHMTVNETINGVLVAAPNAKHGQMKEVVRFDIDLKKDGDTWNVVDKKVSFLSLADYEASKEVEDYAKHYHDATIEFLSNTIGTSTGSFVPENEISGIPEAQIRDTAVIDLINEVQLKYTGADIAAAALFKPTSNIPEGDLSYANIFDIYKYPNTLYAVEVTGAELKQYMEWSASFYNTYKSGDVTISFNPEIRGYNYDMFAGVDYKIDISKPAGERIVDLKFKGEDVKDDQVFKLAVNNYRYGGLKKLGIVSKDEYFNSDPKTLRSYIKDYIEEKGTIEPKVDNNWEVIGTDLNHELRDDIIEKVKVGEIEIPKSEDGRTANVKALNVYDLMEQGKIEGYKHLVITHTNDTHARVKEGKYAGMGLAKVATKVKELRENNKNVLALDAGDTFHGQTIASLVKGESIAKIMNTIGYDAMAPGNHDFNYGQERLVELDGITEFPILAANVVKEDGSTLLTPYIVKELDGIKVGIFGLATPETAYKSHPKNTEGLTFKDSVEVAKEMVKELEGKTDIIVALTHLGVEGNDTSVNVAENVEGIDLIVDGHSHTTLPNGKKVNDTLIVQTGEYDKNLGIVNIAMKAGEIAYIDAGLLTKKEAASLTEDEELVKVVEGIQKENEKITSVIVGKTDINLDGERGNVRTGETNMGNLITEAMVETTGADLAFTNGGGIRASIVPGEISKGDVITVLPFGNYVVMKEIKGSDVLAAIEHGIDSYPEAKGAFPHIAGMTFTFDPSKEAGNRVVEVKVAGKALEADKLYKVATNDFMAAGGDGYGMFKDSKLLGEFPQLDEVLVSYIQKYGTDNAKVDERVKVVNAGENTNKEVTENVYVVRIGDTLGKIAAKYGVTYEEIAKANNIKNSALIFPGDKLVIPGKAVTAKDNTYVVQAGDTLGSIAEKFGMKYQDIADYNNIENVNLIFEGQELVIIAN